jgi:hypothetical protein
MIHGMAVNVSGSIPSFANMLNCIVVDGGNTCTMLRFLFFSDRVMDTIPFDVANNV